MTVTKWGKWSQVVLNTLVETKPREDLLILNDTWTPKEAAEACLITGINMNANAQLIVLPKKLESNKEGFVPSKDAVMGADVIVALGGMSNSRMKNASLQARNKGTRIASCTLSSTGDWALRGVLDVDYQHMVKVAENICKFWEKTETCHVESDAGTDVTFQLKGRPCDPGDGRAIKSGEIDYFPGATPSIAPVEETVNGTIVVNGSMAEPYQLVEEPITLYMEEGVITEIEGGPDARELHTHLDSVDEPEAFHLAHFNVGINPAAIFGSSMEQDEMVMGTVTFGFGDQDPDFEGTVGPCSIHTDVTLRSPTVTIDGTVICEDNKLNPELNMSN